MRALTLLLPGLLLTGLLLPPTAQAHAILMESEPAAQTTVAAGKLHVVLRFNSRIDQPRSRLELRGGPAGQAPIPVPLALSASPDTLSADTTVTPGEWVLRWQVLAVDGHITRGDVPLTITSP
jgi:methionine-rich copper-binding protein CopC